MNILIVDDDTHIQKLISIHLQRAGYQVLLAGNGIEALEVIKHRWPDLAIVDVMMPEMNGLTLTKVLVEQYEIPVLLLTAKGTLEDKEQGFLAGSDDYVVKPFEPKELLYRVAVIIRRIDKSVKVNIEIGNLKINRLTYEVMIGKQTFIFPLKEFEILCLLASKPEQVFTRSQIMEKVWGYDYEGDDHTLNTHITRVRQRLEKALATIEIVTIRGLGYKIEVKTP